MSVERVYIGGFEAERLSGAEIVERLRSHLGDSVEIQGDVHFGSCYCHLNVTSKQENVSGFEAIAKLYNNVKWKGCKLKVERARPHFLERLEEEREATRKSKLAPETTAQDEATKQAIPRFLKIRQKHGEESWKVDTKPITVSDWKKFGKLRTKLHTSKKETTDEAKNIHRKRKPAVHLIFESETLAKSSQDMTENDVTRIHQETSSSSSSDSESDIDSTSSNAHDGKKSSYIWSDDGDSVSDESAHNVLIPQQKPFKDINTFDEFAPAIESSSLVDESDSATSASESCSIDMKDEVEMGLNVLSELFPDVDRKAHSVNKEAVNGTPNEVWPSANNLSGLLMERYDPSQKSAEKYVLAEEEKDESTVHRGPVAMEVDPSEKDARVSSASTVYEEQKLEAVFREAREGTRQTSAQDSDSFAFSFSVAAGDIPNADSAPTDTFGFAFNLGDNEDVTGGTVSDHHASADVTVSKSGQLPVVDSPSRECKRRSTLFTEDELASFVDDFYSLGDGQKIRDDLERYRGDQRIRERWLQERKALTMDWKRKRKHAVARQKSRFR
jgi:hypothetical protein